MSRLRTSTVTAWRADEDGVTKVTSYYDWSKVSDDRKEHFPIVPESALRATLGILERTVRKGL